jgi:hypothetical protein
VSVGCTFTSPTQASSADGKTTVTFTPSNGQFVATLTPPGGTAISITGVVFQKNSTGYGITSTGNPAYLGQ